MSELTPEEAKSRITANVKRIHSFWASDSVLEKISEIRFKQWLEINQKPKKSENNETEIILTSKIKHTVFEGTSEESIEHLQRERCPNCFKRYQIKPTKFVGQAGESYKGVVCLYCGLVMIP